MGSPTFDSLEAQVREVVENRLKAERLFTSRQVPVPALYVEIDGWEGCPFNVKLAFRKWVYDPIANTTWLGSTWLNSGIGMTDGTNPGTVFTAVHRHLDYLVGHYPRVNKAEYDDRGLQCPFI